MYTVVDIETTGGSSKFNRIIEIAMIKYDGEKVLDEFSTLINPEVPIPGFITSLTSIDDAMVYQAPVFAEVAEQIETFTEGQVFVAHSVNFDFGFVEKEFEMIGRRFERKKLCTVRLSRKIIPGLTSYSLGNLCHHLNITINDRHRAYGDAAATVLVLEQLLSRDTNNFIEYALKRNSGEATLPPNLPRKVYEKLPGKPGVYYFHNDKGKVVYVGKAKNIKSRIAGHFTGESSKEKRMFLDTIYDISHQLCGNELVALLEESREIRRLWPIYNRSQKKVGSNHGLFHYPDQAGYLRFCLSKGQKGFKPLVTFSSFQEGRMFLNELVREFELCPKLAGLQKAGGACFDHQLGKCHGACIQEESVEVYNNRVGEAIASFNNAVSTYAIIGVGRHEAERSIVLVEHGTYLGHGFTDNDLPAQSWEELKNRIHFFPDNQDIQRILRQYLKNPTHGELIFFKPGMIGDDTRLSSQID